MITVSPGISRQRLESVWKGAIADAIEHPEAGEVMIEFAPGHYPLPESGVYVYSEVPTELWVNPPGAMVRFNFDPDLGIVRVTCDQIRFQGRAS